MAGNNRSLHAASKAKEDEFYTQLKDIEDELSHYKHHFKDKVVLCNCDDPYESNFFKYFASNFNYLGLKKLITTCYVSSPISHKFSLDRWFGDEDFQGGFGESKESGRKKKPYKIEITEVTDINGDGAIDLTDVELLLQNDANTSTVLQGDGDFRSPECIEALKEADIVVTNPPFSLFREYVATLMKYDKKFVIIGNQNAITYKEFFPLLKENKVWLGYHNGDMSFMVPEDYEERQTRFWIDNKGQKWRSLGTISWYTNLDIEKRHKPLDLIPKYDPEKYPKYDNYDAIEVSKVSEIPCDYMESMGVPITFMDKFCPEQFEIVGFRKGADGQDLVYTRERESLSVSENSDKKEALTLILKGLGVPEDQMEWCNGAMGVPITFLDKYTPEQFEIIGLDRYVEDNPNPGRRFLLRERDIRSGIDKKERMSLIFRGLGVPEKDLQWCNGVMGVPITIMDKYSPDQFQIVGATESEGKGFSMGLWNPKSKIAQPLVKGTRAYKRIFIKTIQKVAN